MLISSEINAQMMLIINFRNFTEDRTCQPKLVWIPSNGNELFMYYTVYDYVEKSYARYATVDNASFLEATHLSLCLDY
uniref:Uncharacterized protein n=1 Tax=Arion vulgaris TaxID=1028688 RepID=A0A0B7BLI7_9EUPU